MVSITTVHNILKRANIRFYSQRPKPQLTRKQKLARVAKAREWKAKMTLGKWRSVIFTDEAKVYCTPVRKSGRLLRKGVSKGERGKHPFPKEGGGSIGLWLAMCPNGILAWQIFKKPLTALDYAAILNEHISTSVQAHFGSRRFIWQQDNAPIHIAKVAQAALENLSHTYGFDILPFPAYSPDLSLVENVIHLIKHRLRAIADKNEEAKHIEELEVRVEGVIGYLNKPT